MYPCVVYICRWCACGQSDDCPRVQICLCKRTDVIQLDPLNPRLSTNYVNLVRGTCERVPRRERFIPRCFYSIYYDHLKPAG